MDSGRSGRETRGGSGDLSGDPVNPDEVWYWDHVNKPIRVK
jgi:hypothetical protein